MRGSDFPQLVQIIPPVAKVPLEGAITMESMNSISRKTLVIGLVLIYVKLERQSASVIDALCLGDSIVSPFRCQCWIRVDVLAISFSPTHILFIELSILLLSCISFDPFFFFLLCLMDLFEVHRFRL